MHYCRTAFLKRQATFSLTGHFFAFSVFGMTGKELRNLRKAIGLPQDKFAAAIGRSRAHLIRYEMGHASIPLTVELAAESLQRRAADIPPEAAE